MIKKEKIFLNNKWIKSKSKKIYKNKSFTNSKFHFYPDCNLKDLNMAINSAKVGLSLNKEINYKIKSRNLYKIYRDIKKSSKQIAKFEMEETGKKYSQALDEINHSANIWLYASKILKSFNQKSNLDNNHSGYINYEPVGIVTLIIPWNFPFIVASDRLPFILAAGNSVIIKPSEYAAKSIIHLTKIIAKNGFPKGAVNLIYGHGNKIGKELIKKKDINMVSFTGSTKVGKEIMSLSSKTLKRLSLELGGKNSIIILQDANIDKSCNIILKSFTLNSGQCCVATSKLLVHEDIKDKITKTLLKKLGGIKDFEKFFGPISTIKQFKRIKKLLLKNRYYKKNIIFGNLKFKNNNHIDPIVFLDLPLKNALLKEEIFGPVLTINSFKSDKEAIEIANDTDYGLSTVICGKNNQKNLYIAKNINSGRIWINQSIAVNFPNLPIGGFKQSGLNRECGIEGLRTYSEIKTLIVKND